MRQCPFCESTDINRIGLHDFQCNDCDEVFDIEESGDLEDDFLDSIEDDENNDEDDDNW